MPHYTIGAKRQPPPIQPPDNENARIWRYMDLAKFVSLLHRKALFFTALEQLQHDDSFEGFIPLWAADRMLPGMVGRLREAQASGDEPGIEAFQSMIQQRNDWFRQFATYTVVNCWHMSDEENMAM